MIKRIATVLVAAVLIPLSFAAPAQAHVSIGEAKAEAPYIKDRKIYGTGSCENPMHGHNASCSNKVRMMWRKSGTWFYMPTEAQVYKPGARGAWTVNTVRVSCQKGHHYMTMKVENMVTYHGREGDRKRPPIFSPTVKIRCQ